MTDATRTIRINRAPVLALWAAVVAQRLGHDRETALTLGQALAGLNAHAKGVRLGIFARTPADVADARHATRTAMKGVTEAELLGRRIPAVKTPDGLRALAKDAPLSPTSVERTLRGKFGDAFDEVRTEMERLAHAHDPRDLAENGFKLYEAFRPAIPSDVRGWGAKGYWTLDVSASSRAVLNGSGTPRLWSTEVKLREGQPVSCLPLTPKDSRWAAFRVYGWSCPIPPFQPRRLRPQSQRCRRAGNFREGRVKTAAVQSPLINGRARRQSCDELHAWPCHAFLSHGTF